MSLLRKQKAMFKPILGLTSAPYTPMFQDKSIDYESIKKQFTNLVDGNVKSVFVNGTTGESLLLSVAERKQVAEKWVQVAQTHDQFKVIVQIGAQNLNETKELAQHAQAIGADAIAMIPPSFFKPHSVDILVDWCLNVANMAHELPFYYYHFAQLTGVELDCVELIQQMKARVPTFQGLKFTDYHLYQFQEMQTIDPELTIFYSREEQMLPALSLGAHAFIGAQFNYMPVVFNRLIEAFINNELDRARKEQYRIIQVNRLLNAYPHSSPVGVGKTIMKLKGCPVGPVRDPLVSLSADEEHQLEESLQRIGFFEWS